MSALGEIARVGTGQSAPQDPAAFAEHGFPFVRAGSLERLIAGGPEDSLEKIPPEKAAEFRLRLYPRDTVVFAKSGMSAKLGRVYRLKSPCYVVSHLATIEPSEKVDPGYLHRWFEVNSPSSLINNDAYPSIKTSVISALEVPLPKLEEQKRIAAILDKADAIRRKRQQAIQLADEFLRAVFLDMFGDPVTNPKGWDTEKLGSVGSLDRGKSQHRPRNDPALLGGPHPLIQTGDVAASGGYVRTYKSTYSELGLRQSKKWPAGTLCITIAANIAKTGILTFDACFPDSVVGFVPGRKVTVEYVQGWLGFLQKSLEASAPESAQKNINLAILRELDVLVPDRNLQEKYSDVVSKVIRTTEIATVSARLSDDLFGALCQRAFAGAL